MVQSATISDELNYSKVKTLFSLQSIYLMIVYISHAFVCLHASIGAFKNCIDCSAFPRVCGCLILLVCGSVDYYISRQRYARRFDICQVASGEIIQFSGHTVTSFSTDLDASRGSHQNLEIAIRGKTEIVHFVERNIYIYACYLFQ